MLDTSKTPILPISLAQGLFLDLGHARSAGEELAGKYAFAEPFPHIVLDNFLPVDLAQACLQNFPAEVRNTDRIYNTQYSGHFKRQVSPNNCGEFNRKLFGFFNSAPVLQFLEALTLIRKLVPDPYFEGGGFHEISAGGKLGIHADFRIHEQLNLQRRLNMLIYLNKDWQVDWGGELELWDRKMTGKVTSIAPIFNRCVIFNTDADSHHGHPEPLACPPDVTRKSIALYYYTASEKIYEDIPANSTMYLARPGDSAEVKAQVRRLRADNLLKDWLPPAVFRMIRQARGKKAP